jgi:hypothetical protein
MKMDFKAKEMSFIMQLFKRKGKEEKADDNNGRIVRCKECGMHFESKDRLKTHDKKAPSGRGERKKMKKQAF